METFQGNLSPARADSSPTFSFYSTCRKGPSVKGLDKEKWEWMRIGSMIPPPQLFKISFSYQIVLIHYFPCLSVSLIWKCSFFRGGKTTTYCYFQKYRRGMNCCGKSGRNFTRRQVTSAIFILLCVSVCVCMCVGVNQYTCNEDFCWWPCLFI